MQVVLPSGEGVTVVKRRRLRREDILIDRDLDFLIKLGQGRAKRDIASAYRISVRMLNKRISEVPPEIKQRVARLVAQYAGPESLFVPDAALDDARRFLKRYRRAKQGLARVPAARLG